MEFLLLMAIITGVLTWLQPGFGFISGALFLCTYAVKLYEDYKEWQIAEREADRRLQRERNNGGPLRRDY